MLLFLYILLVCYVPLIAGYLPIINIGADAPKIDLSRMIIIILFMTFPFLVPFRTTVASLKNSWMISIILFALYVMLSVSWSVRSYTPATISSIFASQFIPVITGIIGLSLFRSERFFTVLLFNYIAVCLALSMIGCYQYLFPPQVIVRTLAELDNSGLRASGTLGNSNLLAIFLVIGIPSVLFLKDRLRVGNMVTYIVFAIIIAGLGATMSRKGAFTAILSPVIYFYFTERRHKAFIFLIIGGFLLAVVFLSSSMFSKRINPEEIQYELSARAAMAEIGLKMFYESPILGKGFGGYYDNVQKFNRKISEAYSAHNIYAEALADYGLIGFTLLATCFLLPIQHATVLFRRFSIANTGSTHSREDAALLLAVMIPFMFSAYFAGGLLYEPRIFCVLYAYSCNAYHKKL